MLRPGILEELTDNPNIQRHISPETRGLIKNVTGPIVEVGGTTAELVAPHILPANPITIDLIQWRGKNIDIIADGKALPFPDNCLGMVLADHICATDYNDPAIRAFIDKERNGSSAQRRQRQMELEAQKDYGRFAANPQDEVHHNLRIGFMREMNRVIQPNGLIAFGAITDQDIVVAESLGWSCVEIFGQRQFAGHHMYDVLFRAPSSS